MISFLGRRLVGGFITLAIFLAALFFLVNALIPGDWTSQFIMGASDREALQERLGIDRPLIEQFWTWMSSVVVLDFGESLGGFPVFDHVREAMATTVFVFIAATVISFPLGYWLGRASAWNQRRWFTIPNTAVAVLLFTAFPPVIAFLVERGIRNLLSPQTYRTTTELDPERWGFAGGFMGEGFTDIVATVPQILWRMVAISLLVFAIALLLKWGTRVVSGRRIPPGIIAAAMVVGSLVGWRFSGFSGQAFDIALSMSILIGGLVVLSYGEILLVTDAAMLDTRAEDFILTARAKGLSERAVRDRHSARAALLPVLSRLVVSIPYFFTGLVILEFMFEVPGGMGDLIFDAINNQDTPLIVGAMAMVGIMTLLLRLSLDVAIAALDPQVRLIADGVE